MRNNKYDTFLLDNVWFYNVQYYTASIAKKVVRSFRLVFSYCLTFS